MKIAEGFNSRNTSLSSEVATKKMKAIIMIIGCVIMTLVLITVKLLGGLCTCILKSC